MQNNNPKHFLSETEFVQLRMELASTSASNGNGNGDGDEDGDGDGDGQTPSEELPPGTEDLPDPAKVCWQPAGLCRGKRFRRV